MPLTFASRRRRRRRRRRRLWKYLDRRASVCLCCRRPSSVAPSRSLLVANGCVDLDVEFFFAQYRGPFSSEHTYDATFARFDQALACVCVCVCLVCCQTFEIWTPRDRRMPEICNHTDDLNIITHSGMAHSCASVDRPIDRERLCIHLCTSV